MSFDYENCTKDTLAEYATQFGITLDMRKSLDTLIAQVKKEEAGGEKAKAEPPKPAARFLLHPVNGRVFEFTQALFEHGLIPCDEDGKRVAL